MISTITNLNLKNEFIKNNTIDSTTGDWSLIPGENNLYLINNKDSKKYKIDITEVT